ncbi:hypothetical protein ABZP36_005547 [Zizania latifolia]
MTGIITVVEIDKYLATREIITVGTLRHALPLLAAPLVALGVAWRALSVPALAPHLSGSVNSPLAVLVPPLPPPPPQTPNKRRSSRLASKLTMDSMQKAQLHLMRKMGILQPQ